MTGPGTLSVPSFRVRGLRSLQIPARPGGRDCRGTASIAGPPPARSRLARSPATSLTGRRVGAIQASSAASVTAAGFPGSGGPTGSTPSVTPAGSTPSLTPTGSILFVTPEGSTLFVTPAGSGASVTPAGSARFVTAPSGPAGRRR
jgi:hypothetical protein